jgi:hypothetical protein
MAFHAALFVSRTDVYATGSTIPYREKAAVQVLTTCAAGWGYPPGRFLIRLSMKRSGAWRQGSVAAAGAEVLTAVG